MLFCYWLFGCVLLARCCFLWNSQNIKCLFLLISAKKAKIVQV